MDYLIPTALECPVRARRDRHAVPAPPARREGRRRVAERRLAAGDRERGDRRAARDPRRRPHRHAVHAGARVGGDAGDGPSRRNDVTGAVARRRSSRRAPVGRSSCCRVDDVRRARCSAPRSSRRRRRRLRGVRRSWWSAIGAAPCGGRIVRGERSTWTEVRGGRRSTTAYGERLLVVDRPPRSARRGDAATCCVLMLGDQPGVTAATVRRRCSRAAATRALAVAARLRRRRAGEPDARSAVASARRRRCSPNLPRRQGRLEAARPRAGRLEVADRRGRSRSTCDTEEDYAAVLGPNKSGCESPSRNDRAGCDDDPTPRLGRRVARAAARRTSTTSSTRASRPRCS